MRRFAVSGNTDAARSTSSRINSPSPLKSKTVPKAAMRTAIVASVARVTASPAECRIGNEASPPGQPQAERNCLTSAR